MLALTGAIPSEHSPFTFGGAASFTARWGRWVDMSRKVFAQADPDDTRVWCFIASPGIFDDATVAGAWRLSYTSDGTPYPLTLLISGDVPAADDSWFEAAARILTKAVNGMGPLHDIKRQLSALPAFVPAPPPSEGAYFWIDDWEVHELHFDTIHDLAADGFSSMLSPRVVLEEV